MKRLLALIFLLSVVLVSFAQTEELYWVSFSNVSGTTFTNLSYVMQIDALGNVKKQPVALHSYNYNGPELTSLASNGSNSAHVWIEFQGKFTKHGTFRLSPFAASGLAKMSIPNGSWNIQAPRSGAFLAVSRALSENDIAARAYGLDVYGMPNGTAWGLSPRTRSTSIVTGLSSSGDLAIASAIASNNLQLYVQPLKSNGLPQGDPSVVVNNFVAVSPDATNALSGNRRFIAYALLPFNVLAPQKNLFRPYMPNAPVTGLPLYVQMLDATTNDRLGAPRLISNNMSGYLQYQGVAIDPAGRFILYSGFNPACGADLVFQALDATGNASGTPKSLVGCSATSIGGPYGFDILKQ